jgi:mono/diheme cytochrome c family protein
MSPLPFALLLVSLAQGGPAAPAASTAAAPPDPAASLVGDPQAGKAFWQGNTNSCKNCHGVEADGGFGPVLAGRKLTTRQIIDAMRKPLWVMPSFTDEQVRDQEAANFAAWFDTLPLPEKPAAWRFPLPPGASRGQVLALKNIGCANCHNPELETPRHSAGAVNADFEWFKYNVYQHTTAIKDFWKALEIKGTPRVRMGNYDPHRLPEPILKEIWDWIDKEGLLTPVTASFAQGTPTEDGVTYTLEVFNLGQRNKGLTAQDVTVTLILPTGAQVKGTTGEGYQSVRHDDEAKADVAVWKVPRIAAKDRLKFTLTLSRPGGEKDNVRGRIAWTGNERSHHPEVLNVRVGSGMRGIP